LSGFARKRLNRLLRRLKTSAARAGVHGAMLHKFRHTYATQEADLSAAPLIQFCVVRAAEQCPAIGCALYLSVAN